MIASVRPVCTPCGGLRALRRCDSRSEHGPALIPQYGHPTRSHFVCVRTVVVGARETGFGQHNAHLTVRSLASSQSHTTAHETQREAQHTKYARMCSSICTTVCTIACIPHTAHACKAARFTTRRGARTLDLLVQVRPTSPHRQRGAHNRRANISPIQLRSACRSRTIASSSLPLPKITTAPSYHYCAHAVRTASAGAAVVAVSMASSPI